LDRRLLSCVLLFTGLPLLDAHEHNVRLDEASHAFQAGDLRAAERLLYEMLGEDGGDIAAHALLGTVLDAEKRYAEAGAVFRRAIQMAPGSATLLCSYASHQLAVGDKTGARATYLKAIDADPNLAEPNLKLAGLAIDEKNGTEALKYVNHLTDAQRSTPEVQALLKKAQALASPPKPQSAR
jgi:Tfp pilus assembly protein PilF